MCTDIFIEGKYERGFFKIRARYGRKKFDMVPMKVVYTISVSIMIYVIGSFSNHIKKGNKWMQ